MSEPSRPGRRRVVVVLLVAAGLLLGSTVWWRRREPLPIPPEVDVTAADPDVAGAVLAARAEVLAEPRSAARWGRLGMVLRAHSFADEANACFAQAEQLDPTEGRWPYYRGLTLALTDPREGLECLRRAVERLGDGPLMPRLRLVSLLLEQGLLDEAARQVDLALLQAPSDPRVLLVQGRLAAARQDWKAALDSALVCRDDPATRKQAHLLAADVSGRLGDRDRASRLLNEARQFPDDLPWHDPLVAEVERLQVGVRVRLGQAQHLARQGRINDAIAQLETFVREQPGNAAAWLLLGQLLRKQDRLAPAEQALVRATQADPSNVEAWFTLGVVRVYRGEKQAAAEAFRRAVRLKPDHAQAHHNLGVCLHDLGDREGARQAWREALRCQPDHAGARQALARTEKER